MTTRTFGAWLRAERGKRDLTREELAEIIGCAFGTLAKLESNTRRPSKALLARILDVLAIPAEARAAISILARRREEPAPQPPHAAPDLPPIPKPLGALIGREADQALILELFAQPEMRLISIVGPPGVGKTTLSLDLAERLRPQLRDGALFVPLADVSASEQVLPAIATACGIKQPERAGMLAALAAWLRERQILLVLDNMEQVIDAAAEISALLQQAPSTRMLVTSREALRISGEQCYLLEPLAVPEAGAEPEEAAAVRLFLARALAIWPRFRPDAEELALIAEICRLLDGLPLAIEIAAAQLRFMELRAVGEQIQARFLHTASGLRDRTARQQTMEGAIDWSHSLLSAAQQRHFAKLAAFAGGWTTAAAAAVLGDEHEEQTAAQLQALADKGLIQREEPATGAETRWRMLRVIRLYAAERLQAEPDAGRAVRERHAHWYRDLAIAAAEHFSGPQQAQWMRTLLQEQDNLRAAMEWAEGAAEAALLAQIAGSLGRFWHLRGMHYEGLRWLDLAYERRAGVAARIIGYVHFFRGMLLENLGDDSVAIAALQEADHAFQTISHLPGQALTQTVFGGMALKHGHHDQARALWQSALTIYQQLDKHINVQILRNNLGLLAIKEGHYQEAYATYAPILEETLRDWSPANACAVWRNAGNAALACGNLETSRRLLETALELGEQSGAIRRTMLVRHTLGLLELAEGRIDAAAEAARSILDYGVASNERNHWGMMAELWAAVLCSHPRYHTYAAQALGAGEALRAAWGQDNDPYQRDCVAKTAARLQAALGPEAFQEHWQAGSNDAPAFITRLARDSAILAAFFQDPPESA